MSIAEKKLEIIHYILKEKDEMKLQKLLEILTSYEQRKITADEVVKEMCGLYDNTLRRLAQ